MAFEITYLQSVKFQNVKNNIQNIFRYLLSETTKKRSEKIILSIAIASFVIHLLLILLVQLKLIHLESSLFDSPIAAIYTPFSFILLYEVYLVIYYLPRSITTYIGKQYEIITLIVIRRLFKDLSELKLSTNWFEIKNDLFWARVVTFMLTVIAALFARYSGDLVAILGAFGWGTFAAAIVPVVVIGFNWKRATPLAANVCIISSLLINFSVKILDIKVPYAIDIGAISLITSMLLFVSISLLSKKPFINKNVEAAMDL